MYKNLLNEIQIVPLKGYQTSATSAVTSDGVDMAGFDGVMFTTTYGTGHSENNFVKVQADSELAFGDSPADLAGTKQLVITTKKTVCVDVYRPKQRYLRLHCTRGTASTIETIYALKYKARDKAVAMDGGVDGKIVCSPAVGTA